MGIHFGPFASPLRKQLPHASFSRHHMKHFQADADAITRLLIRSLITDLEAHSARKRLVVAMQKANRKAKQEAT